MTTRSSRDPSAACSGRPARRLGKTSRKYCHTGDGGCRNGPLLEAGNVSICPFCPFLTLFCSCFCPKMAWLQGIRGKGSESLLGLVRRVVGLNDESTAHNGPGRQSGRVPSWAGRGSVPCDPFFTLFCPSFRPRHWLAYWRNERESWRGARTTRSTVAGSAFRAGALGGGRTGATKNLERSLPTGLRRNERPFGVVLLPDNRLLGLTNEFAPGTDPLGASLDGRSRESRPSSLCPRKCARSRSGTVLARTGGVGPAF
jgi:hypothetical protein